MVERPSGPPDFKNPPLTEVGMSVQFEPLRQMQVSHFGLLWAHFKSDYPNSKQYSPTPPFKEDFSPPSPPTVQFQYSDEPPMPCMGFMNEDKTRLIRLQTDRFSYNWRQLQTGQSYPRYESVRSNFVESLNKFMQFVESEDLRNWQPVQCEIIYLNQIDLAAAEATHGDLDRLLNLWCSGALKKGCPELERVFVKAQHIIRNENQEPIGRLYIQSDPAFMLEDSKPIWKLNVSVRGNPAKPDFENMMSFFDKGREIIVRGFTSITTTEMHNLWGRIK